MVHNGAPAPAPRLLAHAVLSPTGVRPVSGHTLASSTTAHVAGEAAATTSDANPATTTAAAAADASSACAYSQRET